MREPHTLDVEGDLLGRLLAEMAQSEKSASEHARKEAARLGEAEAPAKAMLAIAEHAERSLPVLEAFCENGTRQVSEAIGSAFSVIRDALTDRVVSAEKSYRGSVLGVHHGIGCAVLARAVAGTRRRMEVVDFCDRWLDERRALADACEHQIPWFATHVAVAEDRARA
jgi:hypothetical protein